MAKRIRQQTVRDFLARQQVVTGWMEEAVKGLSLDALVDVEVLDMPFGTYVLSVEPAEDPDPDRAHDAKANGDLDRSDR